MRALALALFGPTLVVMWVVALVDVVRRTDLHSRAKVLWAAVIVLVPSAGALLYVLARPVPVDRTIIGAPPAGPAELPRGVKGRGAKVVQHLARLASQGLFRSVEVVRPASVATTGPQLWAASHFGAFSDPIVLLHALERQPRFLAASFLFRGPVGWLLRTAGAIPVHRRQDRPGSNGGNNDAMFAAASAALAAGDALCVFPEGAVSPTVRLAPLRTGAARIALGARSAGTTGIQIVPVGIHYQDRAALRSRVFVDIGDPIDLDAWLTETVGPAGSGTVGDDRTLVRALTAELASRLREVAPQFTDLEEAAALHGAAAIALRTSSSPEPTWGTRAALADDLGEAPASERAELVRAVETYRAELDALGLGDPAGVRPTRRARGRLAIGIVLTILAVPVAVVAAAVHLPLVLVVRATARLRTSAATKATVRPVVAMVGALVTWGVSAWLLSTGQHGWDRTTTVLAWLVVLPAWGWVALVVTERFSLLVTAFQQRRMSRAGRVGQDVATTLAADRQRIVQLVDRLVPGAPLPADTTKPWSPANGASAADSSSDGPVETH